MCVCFLNTNTNSNLSLWTSFSKKLNFQYILNSLQVLCIGIWNWTTYFWIMRVISSWPITECVKKESALAIQLQHFVVRNKAHFTKEDNNKKINHPLLYFFMIIYYYVRNVCKTRLRTIEWKYKKGAIYCWILSWNRLYHLFMRVFLLYQQRKNIFLSLRPSHCLCSK